MPVWTNTMLWLSYDTLMIISLTCFYLLNQLYRLLFFLLFPFKTPYIVPCSLTVLNPPPSLPNRNGFTFPAIAQSKNQTHITSGELGLPCSCLLAVACVLLGPLFLHYHPSVLYRASKLSPLGLRWWYIKHTSVFHSWSPAIPSLGLFLYLPHTLPPYVLPPYVTGMKREEASVL